MVPQRDKQGRLLKGHPGLRGAGRPPRALNGTTVDLREVRARIVGSWRRVNGDALLDTLARDNPEGYVRIVCSLLPKPTELEVRGLVGHVSLNDLALRLLGPAASIASRTFTESVLEKALEPGGCSARGFVHPQRILEALSESGNNGSDKQ